MNGIHIYCSLYGMIYVLVIIFLSYHTIRYFVFYIIIIYYFYRHK